MKGPHSGSDIVDFTLQAKMPDTNIDSSIIYSLSSAFCDATCLLFWSETFVPVPIQEILVKRIAVMGPYCGASNCGLDSFLSFVKTINSDWFRNRESFDTDHF